MLLIPRPVVGRLPAAGEFEGIAKITGRVLEMDTSKTLPYPDRNG